MDLDDPSAVRKAEPFHGSFPVLGPPTAVSGKVHQRCAASLNAARMILAGYEHNIDEVSSHSYSRLWISFSIGDPFFPILSAESLALLAKIASIISMMNEVSFSN